MVEINDTKVLFLAIWLHETYESQAREVGWKTQESCRVKFDELPEANKKVMLKIAKDICYNLEITRQEGRVEGMKQELKDTLTSLKAIDSELDRRNVDMMLKTLIKIKEKRLKELEKKVLNNEFCD